MPTAHQARTTTMDRILYPLSIRLRDLLRGLRGFLRELWGHPTAVLGGMLTLVYLLTAIFASQLSPHDPLKGNLRIRLLPPAWQEGGDIAYPLGTDVQGRDLLSRIIYGSRVSLRVGFWVVGVSVLVGTTLGTIAGYYRGWVDDVVSRLVDLLLAFPYLVFAVAVMAFLGPGFTNMLIALGFKSWVPFFRLVRAEVLSEKTKEYVDAAKVTGQSPFAIIASEILPNIFHSILVLVTAGLGLHGVRWTGPLDDLLVGLHLARCGHFDPGHGHQPFWRGLAGHSGSTPEGRMRDERNRESSLDLLTRCPVA